MGWNRALVAVPEITCTACIETIESLFADDKNVKCKVVLGFGFKYFIKNY